MLRVVFPVAETGFDPQATSDYYSANIERAIFDSLYHYDWLARPYKLVPNTAAAMPEISADGRVWTIRVKPGIHFADDPVFKGAKRELTAQDYVYSWKRLLDPRMRAPFLWFLDGNGLLFRADGTKRLADNALVALTLLIAESKAAEKNTITAVIVNLINRENL